MRERRDGIAAADRRFPALLGWTRQSSADRLRRTPCCECGRTTRGTASPHRAVLYPAEEVFRLDALGRARSTLHSGMTGAKVAAASHPPGTVRECFPVPTTRHAMGGVGAGFVVHGDRITAAGPSRAVDRSQQWS